MNKILKPNSISLKAVLTVLLLALVFNFTFAEKNLNKETINQANKLESLSIIEDDVFLETLYQEVVPFLENHMTSGRIANPQGKEIYYEFFTLPENKANVMLINGFCEFTKKYDELTYYFLNQGYNVFRFDNQGQGLSHKDITENLSKVHLENFQDHVDNAAMIYNNVVLPNSEGKPIFLFCHSMGGCIGTLLIEEHPEYFKAAVLNAPMHQIKMPGVTNGFAKFISGSAIFFGQAEKYVFGHNDYIPNTEFSRDDHPLSAEQRVMYGNLERDKNSQYYTNGATFAWLNTSVKATERAVSKEEAAKATLPVLLFQAEYDTYVVPKGHEKFATRSPDTKIIYVPGSEHEIFNSTKDVLEPYYYQIFTFYEDHMN